MQPNDEICIKELELMACIGVSEKERARPQRLTASLTLRTQRSFGEMSDDLARTIDYAAVCAEVRRYVSERRDKLIETLAHETAAHLLRTFPLLQVELELRKFILPEIRYVSARVVRAQNAGR